MASCRKSPKLISVKFDKIKKQGLSNLTDLNLRGKTLEKLTKIIIFILPILATAMALFELVSVGYNTVDVKAGASEGVSHGASVSGTEMNFGFF